MNNLDEFKRISCNEKVLNYFNTNFPLYKDYEYCIFSNKENQIEIVISCKFNNVKFQIRNWHENFFMNKESFNRMKNFYYNVAKNYEGILKERTLKIIYNETDIPNIAYNKFIISAQLIKSKNDYLYNDISLDSVNKCIYFENDFIYIYKNSIINNSQFIKDLENKYNLKLMASQINYNGLICDKYMFDNPKIVANLVLLESY